MELNEVLVKKLIDKGYKISTAESCTGGLLASKIVVSFTNYNSVLIFCWKRFLKEEL